MKVKIDNLAFCEDSTIIAVNDDYTGLDYHYSVNKKECLTITTNTQFRKTTAIETTTYELLCTSESGELRVIDIIEVEKVDKKKPTYRHQHRRMALPEGKYLNEYSWDNTQPEKFKALVNEWLGLPYKEVYRAHTGLTAFETRYF